MRYTVWFDPSTGSGSTGELWVPAEQFGHTGEPWNPTGRWPSTTPVVTWPWSDPYVEPYVAPCHPGPGPAYPCVPIPGPVTPGPYIPGPYIPGPGGPGSGRPGRRGWKCPTCGRVWAPWFSGPCDCWGNPAAGGGVSSWPGDESESDPCAHPSQYQDRESEVPYCRRCGASLDED